MNTHFSKKFVPYTVRSESRCALRLEYDRVGYGTVRYVTVRYVDLVVSIEAAVEVCCCFTVFSW
jgi:hypothetical protein